MRALKIVGYAAFFVVAFALALYHNFPWPVVKDLATRELRARTGLIVKAATLSPHWLSGVALTDVKIAGLGAKGGEVALERLTARVGIFSLLGSTKKVHATARLGGGDLDVDLALGKTSVGVEGTLGAVKVEDVPGLVDLAGVAMVGTVSADVKLNLHQTQPKETQGEVALRLGGFKLKRGGALAMLPTEELELGNVELKLPVKEGRLAFDKEKIETTDLSLQLSGNVSLATPVARSLVSLTVGVKPKEKLTKELGPILMSFRQFMNADGYYGLLLSGMLGGIRMPKGVRPP